MTAEIREARERCALVLNAVLKVVAAERGCSVNEIDALFCAAVQNAIYAGLVEYEQGDRPTPIEPLPAYREHEAFDRRRGDKRPKGTF